VGQSELVESDVMDATLEDTVSAPSLDFDASNTPDSFAPEPSDSFLEDDGDLAGEGIEDESDVESSADVRAETEPDLPYMNTVPWIPPFASEVISFTPGQGAGFGNANFPDVVLGPPATATEIVPSMDVLTLGTEGEIILGFTGRWIIDGPGPDFAVHENPFWRGGDALAVFKEFGEVSVSDNGEDWTVFPCEPQSEVPDESWDTCAGWRPTLTFDLIEGEFLTLEMTGGDGFDLGQIGLSHARYIRVRDLSSGGPPPSAGFDLDAISLFWWSHEPSTTQGID